MKVKVMRLADIIPADYNPRITLTETDFEYKALKASIDEFGLVVPLIVNERTRNLISGHQRLNIMLKDGIEETEVVVVDMKEKQEKALCIAMNKVSGQWDYGLLADIMEELRNSEIDTIVTGFSNNEIVELLGELQESVENMPEIKSVDKKEYIGEGVLCIVGEYRFRIPDTLYNDIIADIREKVGFSREMVESELQRRLFKCLSKQ